MQTITYSVNGNVHWFDVSTLQEANKKIAEIEMKYNIPGTEFKWTHPIEEQTKGLQYDDRILLNEEL